MAHDFETLAVHAGIEPDAQTGAIMTPIYQTSTFAQSSPGEHKGYEYARTDNPTRTVLQSQLAALENAEHALVFSSGMSAIDAAMSLLPAGSHIIAGDDLYGGTRRLFTRVGNLRGIEVSFDPLESAESIEKLIRPNTKMIWFETPTNPMLNLIDIELVAGVAKKHGLLSVVDNTFLSPYFQNPINHGIDIVMHSITKYINGHSDVVMGCLMYNDKLPAGYKLAEDMSLHQRLRFQQNSVGAIPGPFDCFLVLRGIKTLAVRMARIHENASTIAKWLTEHPLVEHVLYPGLTTHKNHHLVAKQMSGGGGMISFGIRGGEAEARAFLSRLRIFAVAESLGGIESLAEHPAIMTHASVPPNVRKEVGIDDNLVRLSVGIESAKDLMADIDQALKGN